MNPSESLEQFTLLLAFLGTVLNGINILPELKDGLFQKDIR